VGCLQSDTLVRVHANGSGEIEVISLISEDAADQARAMAAAFAPEDEAGPDGEVVSEPDLFPIDDLESRAADLGEGVRFVRSERLEREGFVGVRAFYEFDDVRRLRVSMEPGETGGAPAGMEDAEDMEDGGERDEYVTFDLSPASGGHSLLSIHLPAGEFQESEATEPADAEEDGSGDDAMDDGDLPSDEELEFISGLFGGFRFTLAVETDGKIVRTNSPYQEGNRVTLFDIDFGRLLQDLPRFKQLAARGEPSSMLEAAEWLQEFEGIKVHLEEELEVEFDPR
jgi:hypothetical protein